MEKTKTMKESRAIKISHVLPPDTNGHRTLFGGKLMAYIDELAAISAVRHARNMVVTASTDSVDFLHPIKEGDAVCLEAFVTWTHKTSMEVFVKAIGENLLTGERNVCAVSFLTFVALDDDRKPVVVPKIIPETEEEKRLHQSADERADIRKKRRENSKTMAQEFAIIRPWDE